jgi:hypothetical protein
MYGCQCPKRLFLHKYGRDLRNPIDDGQQFIMQAGTDVGELARQLFPGGVDAAPPDAYAYQISVEKTKAFIRQGESIIYEAAFQFEGVLCALDILVRKGNAWYAFEVKSSTSVKAQHVQDAALQYFVTTNCGLLVHDISIVFLNNQYVRKGALDTQQLFSTQSVVDEAKALQDFVNDKIQAFKTMLVQRNVPVVDIGPHCFTPYGCDFTNHCFSHMPSEDSIFELPDRTAWKLYADGYKALHHIPDDYELSDKVNMQLLHHRTGEVFIDKAQIRKFLLPLTHPLYFFDFETIMPGIPEFDESKPYQQIPFQYSLHVQRTRYAALEHFSFLGDGIRDPRSELLISMLQHLGTTGSILCYNMNFEKQRIKELATLYPNFEKELLAINERVVDLMIPFARRWYYHPDFKGSYSIKAVLPVLIPELRYDVLPIQEGGMASLAYVQLKWQDDETISLQRQQLMDYCKMDTLAMVKILEYLRQVIS